MKRPLPSVAARPRTQHRYAVPPLLAVALCGVVSALVLSPAWSAAVPGAGPRMESVPFNDVQISDSFWAPRRATNRLASIPVNLENLEKAGNLKDLRLAAQRATEGYEGPVFMDSDTYKAMEAVAYSLAMDPDPALDARLDEIIAVLAAAQHSDGYLNSYYTVKEPGRRWVNLRDNHELYCAGHLFEAAVAHYRATGKTNFLTVARRLADNIDSVFGPAPKRMGYPGHPEIELALVKLWQVTGERRYFDLARFFVEQRGQGFFAEEHRTPKDRYDGSYWQDDIPICDHRGIKGHAVRAAYLMSGTTDIAAETGDPALLRMLRRVWRNTAEKNLYLTGGIGPSAHNEGFTEDYDLPNLTAYQETCASVALAQWAHRMTLLHRDARYADVMERSLYNGVAAGVSHDGTRFFYVNPLESRGDHHRSPWFGCACCPPNVARTLASVGGYAYAVIPGDAVFVNLYIQGRASIRVGEDRKANLEVTSDYPWDGRVTLRWRFEGPRLALNLMARLPGWCAKATARARGRVIDPPTINGYLNLGGDWRDGDEVELDFAMPVERVVAHPSVREDRGLTALQRGPLVYCLEQVDHDAPLSSIYLPADTELSARPVTEVPGARFVIQGTARVASETSWNRDLYRAMTPSKAVALTAVPYCTWDNRRAGPMKVWLPLNPPTAPAGGLELRASVTSSFVSGNADIEAIRDGRDPGGSRKHPGRLCHWWPHKGSDEWVQYSWPNPVALQGAKVYWFDDTGSGECRLPGSWVVEYLDGAVWKPVATRDSYGVHLDRWDEVSFEPVTTSALRLKLRLQERWAAGIHEWKVVEADD